VAREQHRSDARGFPTQFFHLEQTFRHHDGVEYYMNLVKNLQPGVTEVFVHLAMDEAES